MSIRVTTFSCAILLGLAASVAADPLATVIRIADDADALVADRIDGQTVDLDVVLTRARIGPIERGLPQQFQAAMQLAKHHGANVVVWFRRDDTATIVYVADPVAGTVFARRIDAASDTAVAEAAALVVRSALRALAAGGTIGVEAPPPTSEPRPAPRVAPPPRLPPQLLAATPPAMRWHAGVGWQSTADGESRAGQHGLSVELGVARSRWTLAVAAVASLPVTLADELTEVDLARHSVAAAGLYAVYVADTVDIAVGATAGAAAFSRSTTATKVPEIAATPAATTTAAIIGPEARARWVASPGAGIAIELTAGADAVLGAPELGYELDGAFVPRNRLWAVQPRVGLRIVVMSRNR